LSRRDVALPASSFDMPARVLVCGVGFTSCRGGLARVLLDLQLKQPDAIGRYQAFGKDVPFLFLMCLAQETQLVLHAAPALEQSRCFMADKR
jgi:hypothetical protein